MQLRHLAAAESVCKRQQCKKGQILAMSSYLAINDMLACSTGVFALHCANNVEVILKVVD